MENSKEKPKRPSENKLIEMGFVRKPYGWRLDAKYGVIVWYNPVKRKTKKLCKQDKLVPKLYVTE